MAAAAALGRSPVVEDRLLLAFEGETEWHERIVTAHVEGMVYMMLTPDEDHYSTDLSDTADCARWEFFGPRGGVPLVVRRTGWALYRFGRDYTERQLAVILREGERLAARERPPAGVPPAMQPIGGAAPPGAAAPAIHPENQMTFPDGLSCLSTNCASSNVRQISTSRFWSDRPRASLPSRETLLKSSAWMHQFHSSDWQIFLPS